MLCKDRVAIVTGAAGRGMGRSIALTLAREGAAVVVNYRQSHEHAEQIVSYLRAQGCKAIAVQADVIQPEDARRLLQTAVESFGRLDICVIGPGCQWRPAPIDELDAVGATEDVVHEVAPFYNLLPGALAAMRTNKWGRLVGLCLNPNHLPPAYAYNTAKAARLEALMLAHDQAWKHRVTINAIAPGPVTEVKDFAQAVELCTHGPAWINRSGVTPQDIAEGVAFLCSESASFISGGLLPFRW
jgi:3-oxoacyl-[acyl-carrier protein] reductase